MLSGSPLGATDFAQAWSAEFGQRGTDLVADLNNDGQVGLADYAIGMARQSGNSAASPADSTNSALENPGTIGQFEPTGPSFQLNETPAGRYDQPQVFALSGGRYLALWTQWSTNDYSLHLRRFTATGAPLGRELRIAERVLGEASVGVGPDGSFTIAYLQRELGSDQVRLVAVGFDSQGFQRGPAATVAAGELISRDRFALLSASDGSTTFAWRQAERLYLRRYDATGLPLTDAVQLDGLHPGREDQIALAQGADNSLWVVWTVAALQPVSAPPSQVLARRFDLALAPLTPVLEVGVGVLAKIAAATKSDGQLLIAWSDLVPGYQGQSIHIRAYAPLGDTAGPAWMLERGAPTTVDALAALEVDAQQNWLLSWTRDSQLVVQRLAAEGPVSNAQPITTDPPIADTSWYSAYRIWAASPTQIDGGVYLFHSLSADGRLRLRAQLLGGPAAGPAVVAVTAAEFPRPLTPDTLLWQPVTRITLRFSEPMATAGPESVLNPNQYELVLLDSLLAIPVFASHQYDPLTGQSLVILEAASALTDGSYRLTVRGSAESATGAPLDPRHFEPLAADLVLPFQIATGVRPPEGFRVSQTAQADQRWPVITVTSDGGSVVAWSTTETTSSGQGLFFQQFDALGRPLGTETVVDASHVSPPLFLAPLPNGDFALGWTELGSPPPNGQHVRVAIFDRQGQVKRPPATPDGIGAGESRLVDLKSDAAGNLYLLWEGSQQHWLERYDLSLEPLSSAILAAEAPSAAFVATKVQVAVAPLGGFVIQRDVREPSSPVDQVRIEIQRYDAEGAPLGQPLLVANGAGNAYIGHLVSGSTVAMDLDGDIYVAWRETIYHYFESLIIETRRIRAYNASGVPLGAPLQLPIPGDAVLVAPPVVDAQKRISIVWSGYDPTNQGTQSDRDVFLTEYAALNRPPTQIQLSEVDPSTHQNALDTPAVAIDSDGDLIATWVVDDSDRGGIFAVRRLTPPKVVGVATGGHAPQPIEPGGVLRSPQSDLVIEFEGDLLTPLRPIHEFRLTRDGSQISVGYSQQFDPIRSITTVHLSTGRLLEGDYVLTIGEGIIEASGALFDGNGDGPGSGPFRRTFRLLRSATPGDANGDGLASAVDYAIWAAQFGQQGPGLAADFNEDFEVGLADLVLWAAHAGSPGT